MKANPDVACEIANKIECYVDSLAEDVKKLTEKIRCAETVEDVMECKKRVLQVFIDYLPLSTGTCYFCVDLEATCKICPYAEIHGRCVVEGSDYQRIVKTVDQLYDILELYYKGEVYDA